MADIEVPIWEVLKQHIETGDRGLLTSYLDKLSASDTVRAVSRLDSDAQNKLLTLLEPDAAAELIEELPDAQARDLIEDLPDETAAAIMEELASDQQADLLGQLNKVDAEAILKEMDPEDAKDARHLLSFAPDTAGGLMVTEFLMYLESMTVQEVVNDLRLNAETYAAYDVFYAYVVDEQKKLKGVVRIRDLILKPAELRMDQTMIRNPVYVNVFASLLDLKDVFDRYDYFGIPVCDKHHRLVGLVKRNSLREALTQESDRTFLQASGILGGEELRNAPTKERVVKRFLILFIKIGLNLISASVIAAHYDTISAVVALAVFLPIISDMGGSSGNQAVAVSIRELSMGIIKPSDFAFVFRQELRLGAIVGLLLGFILGLSAWVWQSNIFLGLVVGFSLFLNTVLSVCVGGLIPMLLSRFRLDPAIASSAILTTITDCFGFFVVLSLAALMLNQLA